MSKLVIKQNSKQEFEPVKVELTLETFEEFETFIARMLVQPRGIDENAFHSDHQAPTPKNHRHVFGPMSNNNITDDLYDLYKIIKKEQ